MMNNKEAVLVDVREGADYAIGHIFGAVNIPHTKMPTRISELEKHRTKVIVFKKLSTKFTSQSSPLN